MLCHLAWLLDVQRLRTTAHCADSVRGGGASGEEKGPPSGMAHHVVIIVCGPLPDSSSLDPREKQSSLSRGAKARSDRSQRSSMVRYSPLRSEVDFEFSPCRTDKKQAASERSKPNVHKLRPQRLRQTAWTSRTGLEQARAVSTSHKHVAEPC